MARVSQLIEFLGRPRTLRRVARVLWLLVAVAVALRLSVMLAKPIMPDESFRGLAADRYFLDFRDTIWTPGRFLLAGGNPYDPETYLAANPWALSFSPYAPAWLLLGVLLAPLPFLVSVVVFQALGLAVAIVMLRVICRWALPSLAAVAVPAALLWMNIWYPGRGALSVQFGTLLAVLGYALVLRTLTARVPEPDFPEPDRRPAPAVDNAAAAGVGLSLVKGQFGAIVLVALAGGRWREVLRGLAGLAVLSVPVVIACTVAAGGPAEFLQSISRNLDVANSPDNPTGLTNPNQRRLDLLGQLARYGLDYPPAWLTVAVPVLTLLAAMAVVRLTRNPLLMSAVVCTCVLIGVYHSTYDLLLLFIPVAAGLGMALRREITTAAEWITLGALLLVVVHLHTVSTKLVPGLDMRAADTVNLVLLVVGLVAGMYGAVASRHRSRATVPAA